MTNMDAELLNIKKDFFRMRNGVVADSLKKLYPSGKVIFGLNVPQLAQLAKIYPRSLSLGMKLWEDKGCRESRLLSLYIIPPSELDKETALKMIRDVESREEAEFLPFRLLRNLSYAKDLVDALTASEIKGEMPLYCLEMLKKNLALIES